MIRQVAGVLLLGALLPAPARAQTPTPPATTAPSVSPAPVPAAPPASASQRGYRDPLPTDPSDPNYHPGAYHSVVRHNPLPSRPAYRSNTSSPGDSGTANRAGGYFSRGGVGVNSEFYDSRTLENGPNAHQAPVARFDSGGGPDRAEQIAARQAGTQRSQAIQNSIDAYGRPIGFGFGYGYGIGLGGGRLYSYPY